jgi:dTDP-4-dehydrorhamnose reductase
MIPAAEDMVEQIEGKRPMADAGQPRVLVVGGAGMLGHKVVQVLGREFEVHATFRRFDDSHRATGLYREDRVHHGVDAEDLPSIEEVLRKVRPAAVINCVGVIKQLAASRDPRTAIRTNALFPHELSAMCGERGARLIHFSTDCVFSGERGKYTEDDFADARDLYGRTKFLGEVGTRPALTLRTSIVGRELFSRLALVEWYLAQTGSVRGFSRAIYTGLTTAALAREVGRVLRDFPDLCGVLQLSSEPITKYDLLILLREAFGRDGEIQRDTEFHCDRSLRSDRYQALTGFAPPAWREMVREMAADPTPYDQFHRRAEAPAEDGSQR